MTLPSQTEIEIPLLKEIDKAGGRLLPKEAYRLVQNHFPDITDADLMQRLKCGHVAWDNSVQWARQSLVKKGQIDKSVRGVWAITELGRKRLRGELVDVPDKRRKRHKTGKSPKSAATDKIDHDEIAHHLEKVGVAFGFDVVWKPKANDLCPGKHSFKSKRKTLDVAWQIANLTWVPIEVQIKGSVPDLIYRFQQVHQWSLRLVVVTVADYAEEIRESIRSYPFSDKVVVLSPQQVIAATKSLDRLLDLRKTIFEG
jgi:hypothetical protein